VIVVPVLDEAPALPGLLRELAASGLLARTVFADNGSRDGSPELVRAAAGRVVREPRRGYGFACLAGVREAHALGAHAVVCMEGDGTDDPAGAARLVAPVLAGELDLVIGSRRRAARAGGMPFHQRAGNRVAATALRVLFGVRLPDNGPFRAVRLDLLDALAMERRPFAWTTEMTAKAALAGARIGSLETGYRRRSGSSKIGGTLGGTLRASRDILLTLVRLRLAPPSIGRPPKTGVHAGAPVPHGRDPSPPPPGSRPQ
jgi:hypothetical protein